jgi:hypothetical protein
MNAHRRPVNLAEFDIPGITKRFLCLCIQEIAEFDRPDAIELAVNVLPCAVSLVSMAEGPSRGQLAVGEHEPEVWP